MLTVDPGYRAARRENGCCRHSNKDRMLLVARRAVSAKRSCGASKAGFTAKAQDRYSTKAGFCWGQIRHVLGGIRIVHRHRWLRRRVLTLARDMRHGVLS
jgi:hypothetical protein